MGRHPAGFVLGLMLLASPACNGPFHSELTSSSQRSEEELAEQRRRLVEVLRSQGLKQQTVLDALLKVPRHKFVPASHRNESYENRALPLAHEQTISQPYIVGYMTHSFRVICSHGW